MSETDEPELISRRRHYFYVHAFSVAAWLFVALAVGGFVPVHYIQTGLCYCETHPAFTNISLIYYLVGGIVSGIMFSYPFHRIMLVAYSKYDDKYVPLTWMARYGRFMGGKNKYLVILVCAGAYFCGDYITHRKYTSYPDKYTVLHCAIITNDFETAKKEIENGTHINTQTKGGYSPLWLAAGLHRTEIARLLIEKGADVNAQDSHGGTPLMGTNFEISVMLLNKGADIHAKGGNGITVLHWAVYYGQKEVVALLIEKGAEIEAKDDSGQTPFQYAIKGKHKNILIMLINKGADVNMVNGRGETALDIAESLSDKEMSDLIRVKGGKLAKDISKKAE